MLNNKVAGKVALITGSTSGIGLGIAKSLAEQGAHVILNGFGEVEQAKKEVMVCAQPDAKVLYHEADMTSSTQIEEMMAFAKKELGGVDILVNNAGIQFVSKVESFPADQWDKIISINLTSSFHTIRSALPSMKEKNWGRIINIASAHGLVGSVEKSAYVAAKHGLVGLTKVVALENATTGVTCNAVCPGWVLTPLVQKQIEAIAVKNQCSIEEAMGQLLKPKQPSGQFVTPAQLGELVVFLCGDAASNVRGAAWNMDGAWLAQ